MGYVTAGILRLGKEELDGVSPEDGRYGADFFVDVFFGPPSTAGASEATADAGAHGGTPRSSVWQHVDVRTESTEQTAEPSMTFTIDSDDDGDDEDEPHSPSVEARAAAETNQQQRTSALLAKIGAELEEPDEAAAHPSPQPAPQPEPEPEPEREQPACASQDDPSDAIRTALEVAQNIRAGQSTDSAAQAPEPSDGAPAADASSRQQPAPPPASESAQLPAEAEPQKDSLDSEAFDDWLEDSDEAPTAAAATAAATPAGKSGAKADASQADDLDDFMASLDEL